MPKLWARISAKLWARVEAVVPNASMVDLNKNEKEKENNWQKIKKEEDLQNCTQKNLWIVINKINNNNNNNKREMT